MAHDANFVGSRLRLSAFLQCVERGEMPAHPLRFRRRHQILDESAKSLVPIPARVDCNVAAPEAYNEPLVLTSKASTEGRAVKPNVDEEVAIDQKPLETNISEDEALPKGHMHVTSTSDISQSHIPHLRWTPANINEQGSYSRPEEYQHCLEFESILQSRQKAICATTATVEKALGKIKGLSSIRRRRLPVHELALLRTITLDGLPLPGDATVSFATPITVVDPIEDSEIRLVGILSNQTSRNVIITKRRLSPHTTELSNAVRLQDTRPAKSPAKPIQESTPLSTDQSQYRTGFRCAFDGFVGPELQLTSTKRPSRRRNRISIKRQKPSCIRELALGAGSLPVSAGRGIAVSAVLAVNKTSIPDGRPILFRTEDTQPNSRAGQLVFNEDTERSAG